MKKSVRIVCSLMAVLLMVSAFAVSASAVEFTDYYEGPEFICGDVDLDERITVRDATAVQKYLAKIITLSKAELYRADVDGNGKNTISDATWIQKYVAKMIDIFPAEEEVYNPDYIYTASDDEIEIEISEGYSVELELTVETEGYYEITATSDEVSMWFDMLSGDEVYYWYSESDGENQSIFAKLYPGVYYVEIFSPNGEPLTAKFKASLSDKEPPITAEEMEQAKELKAGDEIKIEAGEGRYVYKVDISTLDRLGDNFILHSEDEGADGVITVYTPDCYEVVDSTWYQSGEEGAYIEIYDDGYGDIYYVLLNVSEDSSEFRLCMESYYSILEKEAVEVKLNEAAGSDAVDYDAEIMYKFTPEEDGYYSFNLYYESSWASVSLWILDLNNPEGAYLLIDNSIKDDRVFDVLKLEAGCTYYIEGSAQYSEKDALSFEVKPSDEAEYLEAQENHKKPDPDYNTDYDEPENTEIKLGDTLTVDFEPAVDALFVTKKFVFTAEEDCEIVIYSENSKDACLYIRDQYGDTIHMSDDIETLINIGEDKVMMESFDFAALGKMKKGEKVYLSLTTFAKEKDSFTFSIVNSADYKPIV